MSASDIDKLICETANGNLDAFAELYNLTRVQVYGLAMAILRNNSLSEDIMQEVFIQIMKSAHSFKPSNKGKQWILKIARNLSYDLLKKRKHEFSSEDFSGLYENIESDEINKSIDCMIFKETMDKLSIREREIVYLYVLNGFNHKEIAKIIGIPYATVRWKYHYAIKKLSRFLKLNEFLQEGADYNASKI